MVARVRLATWLHGRSGSSGRIRRAMPLMFRERGGAARGLARPEAWLMPRAAHIFFVYRTIWMFSLSLTKVHPKKKLQTESEASATADPFLNACPDP